MPAVEPPRQQQPMEATTTAATGIASQGELVTQQPRSEPRPQAETELSLRGGGMNLGCTCCDGSCSFHRNCC